MPGTTYVYDTEFLENGRTIDLISIGIVCEDGREYYAVNYDMDHERISADAWLCENVVPHLPLVGGVKRFGSVFGPAKWGFTLDTRFAVVKPKWVIANEVRDFLTARDMPDLWADHAAYDHVALAQLWGKMIDLPEGIPMFTHDIQQELERAPDGFVEPERTGVEHDALDDARYGMELLRAIRGAR